MKAKALIRDAAADRSSTPRCEQSCPIRACSACAGDYEDPECTAEDPDAIADDEERREREPIDEFPTPRE